MSDPLVPDRLQGSLRRINSALNSDQVFTKVWEYRVIDANPGPPVTIDCAVVDAEAAAHLPPQLVGLVLWPGPSGFVSVPKPASIVRIGFVNADPSKPIVVGLDPNSTPVSVFGFAEVTVQLGDPTAAPLTPAAWAAGVATALTALGVSLTSAGVGPLAPLAAIGTALQIAMAGLPPPATTKVLAS
jgi:hypothetical protein